MGTGKSTFIIQKLINQNPDKKYICVLPTLDEIERYKHDINRTVYIPFIYSDKDTKEFVNKTKSLQNLIAEGKSPILATHQLIHHITQTTIDLLKKSDYELIIDECLQCVDIYKKKSFSKDDLRTLIEAKDIAVDKDGFDVVVGADNSIQETDVFVTVSYVFEVFHADYSDSVFQIVHQSLVLIDKDNAALAIFNLIICQIDHLLCLTCSFMSNQ